METPIYAPLELAQMLKNAGWEKVTYFHYYQSADSKDAILWDINDFYSMADMVYEPNEWLLPAPTLREIKLPEGVAIYAKKGLYHIAIHKEQSENVSDSGVFTPLKTCYHTELEARVHAWIFAKRNNLV